MIPKIYDKKNGIDIELDMENGMSITIFMSDETAQDMVNIIQNKLDARF